MPSAFVTNIAFPKFLEEVMFYLDKVGCFDVEKVLVEKHTEWTVPKDCCIGEDVYFMFSKTSIDTIRRLKCQLKNISEDDELYEIKELLAIGLNRGEMQLRLKKWCKAISLLPSCLHYATSLQALKSLSITCKRWSIVSCVHASLLGHSSKRRERLSMKCVATNHSSF